ncbi:hypothetical protein [Qipengyuania gaetbuli]|uniref:hypothetical protein n=1 Tax=Qipengyuania gaetbuli TaxID=266952 RepID=UPI001CFD662E|nr:hypothetical protein [Qipengyuania gaetbuli]
MFEDLHDPSRGWPAVDMKILANGDLHIRERWPDGSEETIIFKAPPEPEYDEAA